MPTTIYDSSSITQRSQNKAIADSFIGRIQSQTNPTTGSAPALGITTASIINSVNEGQMKDIRKNFGCTTINAGCPCAVTTSTGAIINNVIGVLPGPVSNIQANYGSVIVTWDAPTIGVEVQPFTYELTTTPVTLTNTITNGVTTYTYTTPLVPLIPNVNYTFNVRAINSVGTGPSASSVGNFYAPYPAPTGISIQSQNIQYNGVDIAFDNYTTNFTPIPASSTLNTDQGTFSAVLFNDSPGGDSLTVMGLSPSTTYTNCYLVLINGTKRSDRSATFTFTTPGSPPAPTNVVQNLPGSMGPGLALIDFDFYSYFQSPQTVTLTIPGQGTYNPFIYTDSNPTSTANFNSLPSGFYTDCTITLAWSGIDSNIVTTPVSNTFTLNIM
jgi:hypothetical protein